MRDEKRDRKVKRIAKKESTYKTDFKKTERIKMSNIFSDEYPKKTVSSLKKINIPGRLPENSRR